ncbi:hypothetical protein T484DRAFT_2753871 [Baffinella frigidus]|nr:hypothetical protein T484DRAFT_2753871 [Cryptophyta sp. CCMP2293]
MLLIALVRLARPRTASSHTTTRPSHTRTPCLLTLRLSLPSRAHKRTPFLLKMLPPPLPTLAQTQTPFLEEEEAF